MVFLQYQHNTVESNEGSLAQHRAIQQSGGIKCNGLHLQCFAQHLVWRHCIEQHLGAFGVESTTMQSAERGAEHGREQLLRGGDRSALSGSRHTGILAAPAAIPCCNTTQYPAIPHNTLQYFYILQYHTISCNTSISCNTTQYPAILLYPAIPYNTMQYHTIPCNTTQYPAILLHPISYTRSLGALRAPTSKL